MRVAVFAGSLALAVSSAVAIDESKKGDKPTAVRALDVKVDGAASGRFGEPTVIASADELAKAIKDEAAIATVKKAVDFKTERVLFFSWSGSGQDKLTTATADGKKGPEVTFAYVPGRTRDIRPHKKLFAIPKDMSFKVVAP